MAKKRKVLPLKVPARASLYYLLASAVAKAIGVISTPLFTRLMSGESYGEYTLYISRLAFLSVTLSAGSTGVQGYREMSKAKDKQDDYVSSLLGISLTLCGIICILLFTFKGILALNYSTITILTLQLLCDSILYVGNMKAKYLYAYKQVFITSLFQSLISVILSFALINGAELGYEARV
jgi:O-antigen/teichoic acid export membrane protein